MILRCCLPRRVHLLFFRKTLKKLFAVAPSIAPAAAVVATASFETSETCSRSFDLNGPTENKAIYKLSNLIPTR